MRTIFLASLCALLLSGFANASDALPGDSIYQLDDQWRDQHNQPLQLSALRGQKQVIALVYTDCPHTCPVIVSALKTLQSDLPPPARVHTGFVLVSLTPDVDTPEKLRAFAHARGLDRQWKLLTGDPSAVRNLAMALGIRYREEAGGEVSHSNQFTILDEQGRIISQQLGSDAAGREAAKRISSGE